MKPKYGVEGVRFSQGSEHELPEQEKIESEQSEIRKQSLEQRITQAQKDELVFEYGELPPEHPISQYIDRLAKRLPVRSEVVPQVKCLYGWKESNALCLLDQTIYISSGLITEAQSEEALLGVIAHEYVHAYREHIAKSAGAPMSAELNVSALLARLGMRRAQEYDADLRSVLVDLSDAGINPLGYKQFLEQMHSAESSGGMEHGSNLDRALNIATVSHMIDLQGIDNELTPIPEDIQALAKGFSFRSSVAHLGKRPRDFNWSEEEVTDRSQKREEALANLSQKDLVLALSKVWEYSRKERPESDVDPRDLEIFQELLSRYETLFRDMPDFADLSEEQLVLLCGIGLDLGSRIDITEPSSQIGKFNEQYQIAISNKEALLELMELLKKTYKHFPADYFKGSLRGLYRSMINDSLNAGAFGDFKKGELSEQEIVDFEDFVSQSSQLFDEIANSKGLESGTSAASFIWYAKSALSKGEFPEELVTQITDRLDKHIAELSPENVKSSRRNKYETLKLEPEVEKKATEFLNKLNAITNFKQGDKIIQEVAMEFTEFTQAESEQVIADIISFMHQGVKRPEISLKAVDKIKATDVMSVIYNGDFILHRFVERLSKVHPYLKDLSKRELDLVSYSNVRHLGLKAWVIEVKNVRDQNEGYQYLPKYVIEDFAKLEQGVEKSLDRNKFYDPIPSIDELELYYRYLVLDKPGNNPFVFPDTVSQYRELEHEGSRVFVGALVYHLKEKSLPDIFKFIDEISETTKSDLNKVLTENAHLTGSLAMKIAQAVESGELYELSVKNALLVSKWVNNPFLQSTLQRLILEKKWESLDFSQRLELVFPLSGEVGINTQSVREKLVEQDMQTKNQFASVKERIGKSIDELVFEGRREAGLAVLTDVDMRFMDPNKFIAALLMVDSRGGAVSSDRLLKTMLYEAFRSINKSEHADDDLKNIEQILRLTDQALRVILTMDSGAKFILLRKLLTSEGGLLRDQAKKEKFFDMLFDKWVTPEKGQEDITDALTKIKESLKNIDDFEVLYFALQSTLIDKIANPPHGIEEIPYHDLYELEEDTEIDNSKNLSRFVDRALLKTLPVEAQKKSWKYPEHHQYIAEKDLYRTLARRGLLEERMEVKRSPIHFVKDTASKTGALGVRFMQLMPQFVNIAPERMEEFSEVYDRMKGQTKLAAITLLEREWPGFWDEVEAVEDRVGGGSMVTVYRARMKDGQKRVIKVRNPNIRHHLEQAYQLAYQVLDVLAEKHGGGYESAKLSLDDIKDWISRDIDFQGFKERDKVFKQRYEGFTLPGYNYSITIPESYEPSSQFFSMEQDRPGHNLTQWEHLKEQGHDLKQIVSLLTKCYADQIQQGMALSDVHRGNAAITADNKVVIYDRNYFLEISDQEKEIIFSLLNPLMAVEEKVKLLSDYFILGEDKVVEQNLPDPMTEFVVAANAQDWNKAQACMVQIKQLGVRIPLQFTLLLKNFNELKMLATKAGFNSITEVFFH